MTAPAPSIFAHNARVAWLREVTADARPRTDLEVAIRRRLQRVAACGTVRADPVCEHGHTVDEARWTVCADEVACDRCAPVRLDALERLLRAAWRASGWQTVYVGHRALKGPEVSRVRRARRGLVRRARRNGIKGLRTIIGPASIHAHTHDKAAAAFLRREGFRVRIRGIDDAVHLAVKAFAKRSLFARQDIEDRLSSILRFDWLGRVRTRTQDAEAKRVLPWPTRLELHAETVREARAARAQAAKERPKAAPTPCGCGPEAACEVVASSALTGQVLGAFKTVPTISTVLRLLAAHGEPRIPIPARPRRPRRTLARALRPPS